MNSDEDEYRLQAADAERQARSVMNDVDRPPKDLPWPAEQVARAP
jgi:hypothetical protein